jgi:hypothetical protein
MQALVRRRRQSMPKPKLDHCVIDVSDWTLSTAFYRRLTGASLIRRGNIWIYRLGDMQLNCHRAGPDPVPMAQLPIGPGTSDLRFEWPEHVAQAGIGLAPVERQGARGSASVNFRKSPTFPEPAVRPW